VEGQRMNLKNTITKIGIGGAMLTAGYLSCLGMNHYFNNKQGNSSENGYHTQYVKKAEGAFNHTTFIHTHIENPKERMSDFVIRELPDPDADFKRDQFRQKGPFGSIEYIDGGTLGKYDGQVDGIYRTWRTTLTRETDYDTHKSDFDLADKVLAENKQ